MAKNNDSIGNTLKVAILLCLVCAIIVSGAAVSLRDQQNSNKAFDMKKNILMAAGLLDGSKSVDEVFESVETRIINVEEGRYASQEELDALKAAGYNLENFDYRKASKDPQFSRSLTKKEDPAGIKRIGKFKPVFLSKKDGEFDKIILPVSGYALWSTLYGFVALEADLNTVVGLGFYEHAETPGLGGEIDNPAWKALWEGKEIYNEQGEAVIEVIKGKVTSNTANSEHKVDGLSGATLTANGVKYLMQFWMGEAGYASFLENLKSGEA